MRSTNQHRNLVGAAVALAIGVCVAPPAAVAQSQADKGWSADTVAGGRPIVRPAAPLTGWATSIVHLPPARSRNVAMARAIATPPPGDVASHAMEGIASFYWQFPMTASGEPYDPRSLTAAHRTLPFGTHVRVTNMANGKTAVVRINNRGPYKAGRVIDLSVAAADAIEMRSRGIVPVRLEVVTP